MAAPEGGGQPSSSAGDCQVAEERAAPRLVGRMALSMMIAPLNDSLPPGCSSRDPVGVSGTSTTGPVDGAVGRRPTRAAPSPMMIVAGEELLTCPLSWTSHCWAELSMAVARKALMVQIRPPDGHAPGAASAPVTGSDVPEAVADLGEPGEPAEIRGPAA